MSPWRLRERGAVMAEFLLVLPLLLVVTLAIVQLALLFSANLVLEYAAHAAWRSAMVLLPETSQAAPEAAPASPDDPRALVTDAVDYVMRVVSPPLGDEGKLGYAREATQLAISPVALDGSFQMQLTYRFACRIPLVSTLICRLRQGGEVFRELSTGVSGRLAGGT